MKPPIALVLSTFLLTSCGGGSTLSGFGSDDNCTKWKGTWEGTTQFGDNVPEGVFSLSLTQDGCKVRGSVVHQPCVPVTAIKGKSTKGGVFEDDFFSNLKIETEDGALRISTAFGGGGKLMRTVRYTFINVNNVANCPASDTGTVELEKKD